MDSLVNPSLQFLVDDVKCFETIRRLWWPKGVRCRVCESDKVARYGHDDRQPECLWSLLPSWLRPHQGISQEKLPYYLALFEFVHNARCRGKALLGALLAALLPTTLKPE